MQPTQSPTPVTGESPKRIQRKRTRGWRMPEGAVYVGRPTKWGNPWAVSCESNTTHPISACCDLVVGPGGCLRIDEPRQAAKVTFESWIGGRFERYYPALEKRRREIVERLPELRGRDLACWCPLDQPCHADVLLSLANPAGGE